MKKDSLLQNNNPTVRLLVVLLALLFLCYASIIIKNKSADSIGYDAKSREEIEALLHSDKPVIVAFGADYCPTCENYMPYIKELNALYGNKIRIKYVDVVENEEIRSVYNIELIPSTIFFTEDGEAYQPGSDLELENSECYDGARRYVSELSKITDGSVLGLNEAFEYGQGEHGELVYCKYIGLIDMVHLKQIAADLLME